jgi:hypothetical protein
MPVQVYADKSRECGKPSGSPRTPISVQQLFRQPSRNRLERLETNMVRKRALVEAIPAVMVVHELRNLVLHDGGFGALVHKRGQEASIRQGLENQARLKDPEFVSKRIEYVDRVMTLLPQASQEILGRFPSCAVVGNAVRIRGLKTPFPSLLLLLLLFPNGHALSCSCYPRCHNLLSTAKDSCKQGILKLQKHGPAIDAHSIVIRINQARTSYFKRGASSLLNPPFSPPSSHVPS